MRYVPPAIVNGLSIAKFHQDEIQVEVSIWRFSLVRSVCGMIPCFHEIGSFVINHWKLLGLQMVHYVKEDVFLFAFEDQEAKIRVLKVRLFTFIHRPLIIHEWKPMIKFDV